MQRHLEVHGESTALHLAGPATGTGAPILLFLPWWGLKAADRRLV